MRSAIAKLMHEVCGRLYDGKNKHRTRIGVGALVSVDTMFVAPVSAGDDAYTAAWANQGRQKSTETRELAQPE
jgi:hypothetical protein